jgi:predicted site-specific integrase-resolvase
MARNGFRIPDQLLLPWSPRYTISAAHAGEMLDVSINTICRMIEDGTIKAYKTRPDKANSPWRVNYDSVIAHIERIHKENGLEKRF